MSTERLSTAPATGPGPGPGPLPGVALGQRPQRPATEHWSVRLRDLLSTYLPLVMMLGLAGATWWLVRITPVPDAGRTADPSPQTPDYTLSGVELLRHRADGSLMARLSARELRHYPVGDRLELDGARIVADHVQGDLTARALRAVVTEQGRRVRLEGEVVFSRAASATQPAFDVHAEVMDLDVDQGRAWSDGPVRWLQEGAEVRASGFEYRQEPAQLSLRGPVRALLLPGKSLTPGANGGGRR